MSEPQYHREAWEYYKSKHICVNCHHVDAIEGGIRCEDCYKKKRARDNRHWQKLRQEGKCPRCKSKHENGYGGTYCRSCMEIKNATINKLRKDRRKHGECQDCGKPAIRRENGVPMARCGSCQIRKQEYDKPAKRRKEERRKNGLCYECGLEKPKRGLTNRGVPMTRCVSCIAKSKARRNARKRA